MSVKAYNTFIFRRENKFMWISKIFVYNAGTKRFVYRTGYLCNDIKRIYKKTLRCCKLYGTVIAAIYNSEDLPSEGDDYPLTHTSARYVFNKGSLGNIVLSNTNRKTEHKLCHIRERKYENNDSL